MVLVAGAVTFLGQHVASSRGSGKGDKEVSFKEDVFPIFKKQCLPCHAEDNYNPSELSLDSYERLVAGGEHGVPVAPGNAKESILIQKLGPKPPFGRRMPLDPKVKKGEVSDKRLTDEEVKTVTDWVEQGAKNN